MSKVLTLKEAQKAMIDGYRVRNIGIDAKHYYYFTEASFRYKGTDECNATFFDSENGYEIIKEKKVVEWFRVIAHNKKASRPLLMSKLHKSKQDFFDYMESKEENYYFIKLEKVCELEYEDENDVNK